MLPITVTVSLAGYEKLEFEYRLDQPPPGAIQKSVFTPAYRKLIRLLVDARTKANLSQRQLAARLGCHPSWVAKVELGERRLDVIEFVRLVRALGKDPAKTLAAVARHVR